MMHTHHWVEWARETFGEHGGQNFSLADFEQNALSAVQFDFGDSDAMPAPRAAMMAVARPPFPLVMAQFATPTSPECSHVLCLFEDAGDNERFIVGCRMRAGGWSVLSCTTVTRKQGGGWRYSAHGHAENSDDRLSVYAMVKNAFAVIACSNVAVAETHPPVALNKKRARNGKPPILTYKTLVLKPGVSTQRDAGGSHASPRVHLRRGHIRQLADKSVWVQPCVVGDKRRGMVVKEYRVDA